MGRPGQDRFPNAAEDFHRTVPTVRVEERITVLFREFDCELGDINLACGHTCGACE